MPPELEQAPIAITHLGRSIWSYTWRSAGAILCDTRPDTIIRSAWRGEERNTSDPKRAMSYRGEGSDIISIAQQARPKPAGQIELDDDHAIAFSSVVSMTYCSRSPTRTASWMCTGVTAIPAPLSATHTHRRRPAGRRRRPAL